jgi:hypothetical protein
MYHLGPTMLPASICMHLSLQNLIANFVLLFADQFNYSVQQAGSLVGLKLLLDVQQAEYFVANSLAAGFRVCWKMLFTFTKYARYRFVGLFVVLCGLSASSNRLFYIKS